MKIVILSLRIRIESMETDFIHIEKVGEKVFLFQLLAVNDKGKGPAAFPK